MRIASIFPKIKRWQNDRPTDRWGRAGSKNVQSEERRKTSVVVAGAVALAVVAALVFSVVVTLVLAVVVAVAVIEGGDIGRVAVAVDWRPMLRHTPYFYK